MELSNRDYPFHDYHLFEDGAEPTSYVVGKDNQEAPGDHNKPFVSKSTLLIATATTTVRFNHGSNVLMTLIANIPYTFESNIRQLFVVDIGADGALYAYFEGVLPDEARRPE